LLGEWRDYSEKLRVELDQQAEQAGAKAGEAMGRSLSEFGQAGERLEDLSRSLQKARSQARGLSAVRGPWLLVLAVQLLVGAVLVAVVLSTGRATAPVATIDAAPPPDAAPVVDAAAPDAAPVVPASLCSGLLRGIAAPSALQVIRGCAVVACGFEMPAKGDRGNRALRGALAQCKPERDGALLQELLEILASKKMMARCKVVRGDDGSFVVDTAFVSSCRGDSSK
jgi:hypothetical protein